MRIVDIRVSPPKEPKETLEANDSYANGGKDVPPYDPSIYAVSSQSKIWSTRSKSSSASAPAEKSCYEGFFFFGGGTYLPARFTDILMISLGLSRETTP